MEKIDKSFPFTNFRKLLQGHSRAQSSLLIQIRSGHIPLNAHLYKLNCVDSDKCQACHTQRGTIPTRETITHFLFDCPAYQDERHYLDASLGRRNKDLKYIMSKRETIQELLRYIGRTKRLKRPFGNITPGEEVPEPAGSGNP